MSGRKSGLGKGLGALIPTELTEPTAGTEDQRGLVQVPISDISPNPFQPREHFDEESLAGLTASIKELGVLQPVLVRAAADGKYELIAGERRWRACRRAGLPTIPVIVRSDADTDHRILEQALVENLHREDLNAIEEAAAYQQLMEDFGLTQEAVAQRVGKSRAAVTNTLRLFQLPPAIQALVAENALSAGHARALLGSPDRSFQTALAARIIDEGLSVRETEEAVRQQVSPSGDDSEEPEVEPDVAPAKERSAAPALREPGLLELEHLLSDHLETRVSVTMGAGKGKVQIQFADLADLERIYRRMVQS